ncbi:hypothetical protein, partial [Actinoallomurus sp. NPDC052274]|uniref:hypothetical protein n=1 Tax=Actinoallomurus sp. NPDC052274 TaxID=3155420 RepID=UPI00342F3E35
AAAPRTRGPPTRPTGRAGRRGRGTGPPRRLPDGGARRDRWRPGAGTRRPTCADTERTVTGGPPPATDRDPMCGYERRFAR